MTTVVNIKHDKYDFWCARGSIFGNPFILGRDGERDEVCDKFDEWFEFLIKSKFVKDQLKQMKNKRLGCFCKQTDEEVRCHVDTIARYIDNNL